MSEDSGTQTLITSLLLAAMLAAGTTFAAGWAATTVSGGEFDAELADSLVAVGRLMGDPGDPAAAWDDPDVPGPALYWAVAVPMYLVAFGAAYALSQVIWRRRWGFQRRRRFGVSPEATLASIRDLAPLHVDLPIRGRFLLGRKDRQLLATENRATQQPRRFEHPGTRARRGDRGAVALVGPSRSGKTTAAVTGILEWDGPVVMVSVKDDLLAPTLPHRRTLGECAVFDPTGDLAAAYVTRSAAGETLPGWDDRLIANWSPLAGVVSADSAQAAARAVCESAPKGGVEGGDFWMAQAQILLSGLFWIAVYSGHSMADVVRWVLTKDCPGEHGSGEVSPLVHLALRDPGRLRDAQACDNFLSAVWDQDDRTRSSIYATANTVIWPWTSHNVAAASTGTSIDLTWLTSGANTLYLTAPPHEFERLTPLYGGMVNGLLNQCFAHASTHGPLDPPLLFVLDEAGNMPLERLPTYASTVAGLGVQLVTMWQDVAQIKSRYQSSADTVLANHLTKVFFPGTSSTDGLDYIAKLVGEEEVATSSETLDIWAHRKGSVQQSAQRVTLAPANVVRQMQPGQALMIHGTLPPAHIDVVPFYTERRLRSRLTWSGQPDQGLPVHLANDGATRADLAAVLAADDQPGPILDPTPSLAERLGLVTQDSE